MTEQEQMDTVIIPLIKILDAGWVAGKPLAEIRADMRDACPNGISEAAIDIFVAAYMERVEDPAPNDARHH